MLRSLELFGFKSFADRTSFEFDPGVTCVVGPNGSGKSNVVDAIKWILGDQSAKSLRGSEMLDVVFNGSTARKPAPLAEAIITFDNDQPEDQRLFDLPDSRVAVGRRLYRSGESEYLINGEAVRLKDVRHLFLTGSAGTAAYSIIEQGRVDQILNANAAARRSVFEEAAGVSKFKAQRKEAERRLDTVGQHLTRLTDIVDELETRLSATRSQASKAAKYRDLSKELRTCWLGLAADDTRHFTTLHDSAAAELTDALDQRRRLDESLQAEASRRAAVAEKLTAAEESLARVESARAKAREEQAELRSTLRALSSQRESLRAEAADRAQQWQRALRQVDAAETALAEAGSQLEDVREKQTAHIEAQTALDTVLERSRTEAAEAAGQVEALEARLADTQTALDAATASLQEIRSERTGLRRRRDQIAKRLDSLDEQQTALAAEVDQKRGELQAAESARGSVQDDLTEARQRRADLAQQLAAVEKSIGHDTQERTAAQARQTVLRDLQQRGDGIGVGVREIVQRAADAANSTATGRSQQPWASISGLAGELLDCRVEDAPLLDLALGSRSQLVVTSDLPAVIAYLEAGPALGGRVGFVELRTGESALIAPAATDVFAELETFYAATGPDLSHEPGVRRRADQLVTTGGELARRLLADTWLVDRLATARKLARRYPGVRLLTLSGELIEADGSLHVGPAAPETAVLERRSELRQLSALIARLGRRLSDDAQRRDRLIEAAELLDTELAELERSQPDAHQRAGDARTSVESLQSQLDRVRQECVELADEADAIDTEDASLEARSQTIEDDRAQIRNERKSLQRRLETATKAVDAAAAVQADLGRQQQQLTITQAQLEERFAAAESTQTRLSSEIDAARRQVQAAAVRLAETESRLSDITLGWLNTRSARDRLAWHQGDHQEQRISLLAARDAARAEVDALRIEEDEVRSQRQAVGETVNRLELTVRDAARELEQLTERMAEEFGLSLDEVLAVADEEQLSAYAAACTEAASKGTEEADLPAFEDIRDELDSHVQRLRRKIRMLGSVNTDALADLESLETRHDRLAAQLQDLVEAKSQLEAIIARINEQSQTMFLDTFEAIRGHFQVLFRKLFGGGQADLVLEESDDILECGLDIVARPPGKELRGLSLLSGGEKTMTAVALLLAMFRAKPSPYCLLDEVDAALDEGNIGRFVDTVSEFRDETQFIVITHRKRTMMAADRLYGVTMETAGVSKRMSVDLDEVADDGAIRKRAA